MKAKYTETARRARMTDGQVGAMLEEIGLEIKNEDDTHFMLYCPFHANFDSPAFSVAKDSGKFVCFNPSCDARGDFDDLLYKVNGWNMMRSRRFVLKHQGVEKTFEQTMKEIEAKTAEMPEFNAELLAKMQKAFWESDDAKEYMHWRGFTDDTLKHFGVGYDPYEKMVVVPMIDNRARCVGMIGRTAIKNGEKRFKNSLGLPTKKTLFNINNAKRAGVDSVILVESSYDAMRIHQAGFPNVCATLGGTYSDFHVTQVNRHFDRLISMIDADEAGLKFNQRIAAKTRKAGVAVFRGKYTEMEFLPNGAKDVCDQDKETGELLVSEADIRYTIENADMFLS
jgi:DNA primase